MKHWLGALLAVVTMTAVGPFDCHGNDYLDEDGQYRGELEAPANSTAGGTSSPSSPIAPS